MFLKKKKFAFRTNYQTNDFIKRRSNFLGKNILTPNIRMEMSRKFLLRNARNIKKNITQRKIS